MKRKFTLLLMALFALLSLHAALGSGRELEANSPYYQPDRSADASDFRIIMITDCGRDVEEHILLIAPDGKTTLVDCGLATSYPDITRVLNRYGITHIDQIVISHLHDDHIGGLPAILPMREYSFGEILWELIPEEELNENPVDFENNKIRIQQVKERAAARGIKLREVRKGDTIDFGSGASGLILLSAPPELTGDTNLNNKSLIIRLEYGDFSMLFTGDMSYEQADILLASGADIKVDVLKLAHHGGAYGTSTKLLQAVAPSIAVASMPQWLSEDPRGQEVDALLHAEKIPHYRTWEFNETRELVIASDGKDFFITPYGQAPPRQHFR